MNFIDLLHQTSLFLSIVAPLIILVVLAKIWKEKPGSNPGLNINNSEVEDLKGPSNYEPLIVVWVPKQLLKQTQLSSLQSSQVDVKIKEALDKTRRKRVEKAKKLIWREGES